MSLTNQQYESIIKGYEKRQNKNRALLSSRREQVYAGVPGYRELEESVSALSVSAVRKMLLEELSSTEELHRKLAEVAEKKQKLLIQAGFPPDYLEPVFTCPLCEDTGYVTSPLGPKTKCQCFRRQEIELLYNQSNIRDVLEKENFSTLSYEYYAGEDLKRFEAAVRLCRIFVQNFKQDYRNLFFYGTVGTGKSFLSGCAAKELLEIGCSVIYFSASGLFDTLARYSFDSRAKDSLLQFHQDLYSCDLVIIDDLGTEVTNSFVTSQLFALLNERHLHRKSTIISTNLSLEELRDRYSDRIFSRITSNYSLCKLTGPDIRIYKKRTANVSNG